MLSTFCLLTCNINHSEKWGNNTQTVYALSKELYCLKTHVSEIHVKQGIDVHCFLNGKYVKYVWFHTSWLKKAQPNSYQRWVSSTLFGTLDSGIDVPPGINVAPPLKIFHIAILTLFYINLGIEVIFDFIFSSIFLKN